MAWTKEDKSFKTLLSRRATDSAKRSYEEFGDNTLDINSKEVKMGDIPFNDPSLAVTNGLAQLFTLFSLTEDTTVANQRTYFAFQSGNRLKNWLSDKYGDLYTIKLFDNSNNQIFPTDASDWIFDYVTGILTFNNSVAAFSKPFKITGYRYIGPYLFDAGVGANQDNDVIVPISSDNQTVFNLGFSFNRIRSIRVNGLDLRKNEYSLTGNVLTFLPLIAQYQLSITDELVVVHN